MHRASVRADKGVVRSWRRASRSCMWRAGICVHRCFHAPPGRCPRRAASHPDTQPRATASRKPDPPIGWLLKVERANSSRW